VAKIIEVKVSVPDWVCEDDVRRVVEEVLERLSRRIPADKLREILVCQGDDVGHRGSKKY